MCKTIILIIIVLRLFLFGMLFFKLSTIEYDVVMILIIIAITSLISSFFII